MTSLKMYTGERLARLNKAIRNNQEVDYESLAELMGTTPTSVKTSLSRRKMSLKKIRDGDVLEEEATPEWYDLILKHPYIRKQAARRDMTARGFVQALVDAIILHNLSKAVLDEVNPIVKLRK